MRFVSLIQAIFILLYRERQNLIWSLITIPQYLSCIISPGTCSEMENLALKVHQQHQQRQQSYIILIINKINNNNNKILHQQSSTVVNSRQQYSIEKTMKSTDKKHYNSDYQINRFLLTLLMLLMSKYVTCPEK